MRIVTNVTISVHRCERRDVNEHRVNAVVCFCIVILNALHTNTNTLDNRLHRLSDRTCSQQRRLLLLLMMMTVRMRARSRGRQRDDLRARCECVDRRHLYQKAHSSFL
jgi:hypothetical protein